MSLGSSSDMESTALKHLPRIYTEKASGAQRDRPQLHAALDYMRAADTLVVWKLDRLARSLRQLLDTVEALHSRQMGLRSLTEAIDTSTPGGTLVFHLFGALAEFERSIIRERTRAGLAAARARGRTGGRPPALSAADKQAARALLRDPARLVKKLKRLMVRELRDRVLPLVTTWRRPS
jgi:DNA invertase Pin-like site-specific DNA recombinase